VTQRSLLQTEKNKNRIATSVKKTEKTKNRIATTVKKHKNRKKLEKNWKSMVKSEKT
jgi:hypothetical protein